MKSKTKLYLMLLTFTVLVISSNVNAKTLKAPDKEINVEVKHGQSENISINNGSNTQIAVKLEIIAMPDNAQLLVTINGEVEELDWQEGQSYLFKTLDNSGHCVVDMIGELQSNQTGPQMEIELSYEVLPNGDFLDVEDELTYLNSILIARKNKYINQPMSVLISDLDKYQLPIYDIVPSKPYGLFEYKYRALRLCYPFTGIKSGDIIIYVDLDKLYDQHSFWDVTSILFDNDMSLWTTQVKNIIGSNVVKDILSIKFGPIP